MGEQASCRAAGSAVELRPGAIKAMRADADEATAMFDHRKTRNFGTPGPALWMLAALLAAETARADGTHWFTADQTNAGRWAYEQRCATCHGVNLEGSGAPALVGSAFNAQWDGKTLQQFYGYVHGQMPLGAVGTLKGQDCVNVVAYILARSGLPAGTQKLTMRSPMNRVLQLSDAQTAAAPGSSAPTAPVTIGALVGTVSQPTTNRPTQAELDAADAATGNWLMYNKGYRGERFSTLARVNTATAANLRAVCMFQLGELGTFSTGPVVYDGLLYATTHLGTYAIDATTCEKKWTHHHIAVGPEMNATNKGVALHAGRVIRGTQDGFLYALDAKTGAVLWKRQVADWRIGEGIGAAPTVWNGLVYIAKAGGDWGIQGRLMAFKVEDSSPAWHFDLIRRACDNRGHDPAHDRAAPCVPHPRCRQRRYRPRGRSQVLVRRRRSHDPGLHSGGCQAGTRCWRDLLPAQPWHRAAARDDHLLPEPAVRAACGATHRGSDRSDQRRGQRARADRPDSVRTRRSRRNRHSGVAQPDGLPAHHERRGRAGPAEL
jgi:mono/diheme cytochrome c family protein